MSFGTLKTNSILTKTIASILILAPFGANAASDTISGANPAWATPTNWSLGALPTAADNVIITATGTVDIRGSAFAGQITEVQDLTFSTAAAMSLANNSTSADMTLVLNGTRGVGVPLIATTGNFTYTITGTGSGTHLLSLHLNAGGSIDVAGTGRLDEGAALIENGGSFALTKTGSGVLSLGVANTFTGGLTVSAGTVEIWNSTAAGTGPIQVGPGARLALRNVPMTNAVTVNGGEMATRSGDLSSYDGPVNITADSTTVLRSFTTPANDQSITVGGKLSGAVTLTILGNATNATSGKAFILTNPSNDFSGTFVVTANQRLRNAPASTGNTLGTATVALNGGALQLRDDGTGSGTTIVYNNNVTVGSGGGVIDVDRVSISTDNTFQLGSLAIGNQKLTTTGLNNYGLSFSGPVTLSENATFETAGAPLKFNSAINGPFGITTNGTNPVTLGGTNTYTGQTNVAGGTLVLTGSIPTSPQINVSDTASLDVTGAAGGFVVAGTQTLAGTGAVSGPATVANNGTVSAPGGSAASLGLSFGQLTLGQAPGDIANLAVTLNTNPGKIIVTMPDGLVLSGGPGSAKLQVSSVSLAVGTYTLVDYEGAIGGAGFGGFAVPSLPPRTIATLVNNIANTSVDLSVTGADFPVWTGAVSSQWSTAIITNPKNWRESNSGINTDFINGDRVVFNDTGVRNLIDVSVEDVRMTNLVFDHSLQNYTITGTKSINGTGGLVKLGNGTLTIGNVNGFTGPVSIGGGVLSIGTIANSGTASALGAGSAISIDGGVLHFTGTTGTTNRTLTIGTNGGTIQTDGILTVSGSIGGTGNLAKTGTGSLILTGTNNTYTDTTITNGILRVGDGTANAGAPGTGVIANQGELIFDHSNTFTIGNLIEGIGKLRKGGTGTLTLGGSGPNTYSGGTIINGGILIAGKPPGTDALGDLTIETGGTFRYLTNNVSNQIADSASVTINGGMFGDPTAVTPTNPGATDTIANLTINAGTFGSGRNVTVGSFMILGALKVNGGVALAQRGGVIFAESAEIGAGSVNLDGGSTTAGQESRFDVGSGGLKLTSGTINLNSGPSAITATSNGSLVNLNGDVVSTGTSRFVRLNPAQPAPKARIDLGGLERTFDVTGTLQIGGPGAPVEIDNGSLTKAGTGSLVLAGNNTYLGETKVNAGTLVLTGTLSGTTQINVAAGATFDVSGVTGGDTLNFGQTLMGDGNVVGNVIANGAISPGNSTFGTLHFGDALTLAGSAEFEIGSIGPAIVSDLAIVGTNLVYGGTLNVLSTGQPLGEGDVFNLFDATTFSGAFTAFNLPPLDPGLFWDISKLPVDGTILVVPEPGSCAALAFGLALSFGAMRPRTRAGSCKARC
jgi:fibronectin-binding autotransporter adhesin